MDQSTGTEGAGEEKFEVINSSWVASILDNKQAAGSEIDRPVSCAGSIKKSSIVSLAPILLTNTESPNGGKGLISKQ